MITVDHIGVHATHCCPNCGCKYGDPNCPVLTKLVEPVYKCEECVTNVRNKMTKYYWNDKPPTLKEFTDLFNKYVSEILVPGESEGYIQSHKIIGDIYIDCVNDNSDTIYEIVDLDMNLLGGCGCPSDITIKIRKCEEE
jgi:hypothetical protein